MRTRARSRRRAAPPGSTAALGALLCRTQCVRRGRRSNAREGAKLLTLTCPRTLMDTMFGSASLLSAFTLSSALLIVSLRLCGVVREQEARWGGALM